MGAGTDHLFNNFSAEPQRSFRWKKDLSRMVTSVRSELDAYQVFLCVLETKQKRGNPRIGPWLADLALDESWAYEVDETLRWICDWGHIADPQTFGWSGLLQEETKLHRAVRKTYVAFQNLTGTSCTRMPRKRLDVELATSGKYQQILRERAEKGISML